MEYWRDIDGYDNYCVSNLGRVRRNIGYQSKTNRVLSPIDNGSGYKCVCLSKNSKVKRFYVHRLVAGMFLDNNEDKEEVNHIDGDRSNNKLNNLEWVTRSENHYHRYKVLNQRGVNYGKTGVRNWNSKPCLKFDLNGKFLKRYAGVMEASRQTNIGESNIRISIYNENRTAGGYKWKYE